MEKINDNNVEFIKYLLKGHPETILDNEESQEIYNNIQANQINNVFIPQKDRKTERISKQKFVSALTGLIPLGEIAVSQLIGAKNLEETISPYYNDIFYVDALNGQIINAITHQPIHDEKSFFIHLCEEITKQGYTINEIAASLDYGKGIRGAKIPNSTILGRINAKTKAFQATITNQEIQKKGAQK